jgi:hypothetical protein
MPLYDKALTHDNHDTHLCSIVERGSTINEYRQLVISPVYLCRQCGRTARLADHLCDPIPL